MKRKLYYLACFILMTTLIGVVQAVPLAPDDASVKDNLCLWLRSPEANFDPATGIWIDVSGRGNDAETMGLIDAWGVTYASPTLSFGSNESVFEHAFSTLRFGGDTDDLMKAPNINGGVGFSEITVIGVYKLSNQDQSGNGMTRPFGVGSFIGEGG